MNHSPDFSVRSKIVIVTGAARGLGLVFAESLAHEGAKVVLLDTSSSTVGATANTIVEHGGQALAIECDITDQSQAKRAVDLVIDQFGAPDALVNNAGINQVGPSEDVDVDIWRKVIDVNLIGTYLMSRSVAASMISRQRGSIVNIASIHASVAPAFHCASAYATSKAGVLGLTRALAVEWGKYSVRVNALAPGFVRTEMTQERLDDRAYLARIMDRSPIPRMVESVDLIGALHYLIADTSRMMTGQTLSVDGGWLAV